MMVRREFLRLALAGLLAAAALPGLARADDPQDPERQRYERWQKLSPEEKQRVRERVERLKSLPPEQQQRVRERYERWQKLSPQQQEKARERFERWQQKPPEEKQKLRERWRSLSPEQRESLQKQRKAKNGGNAGKKPDKDQGKAKGKKKRDDR